MITDLGRILGFLMVTYALLLMLLWATLGHLNPRVQRAAFGGQVLLMAAFLYVEFVLCTT